MVGGCGGGVMGVFGVVWVWGGLCVCFFLWVVGDGGVCGCVWGWVWGCGWVCVCVCMCVCVWVWCLGAWLLVLAFFVSGYCVWVIC